MSLTDTQRAILAAAAQRPEHLVYPPERLPAGARQKVAGALLRQNLVIGVHRPACDASAKWTVQGEEMLLKITDDGLRAIGIDPNAGDAPAEDEQSAAAEPPAQDAPTPAPHGNLRNAATAVLAASDDEANREADIIGALERPIQALRTALAGRTARQPRTRRDPATPRKPREGTKREQVLAMLRREEGATVAQVCEAIGWQPHTVRGFLAGIKARHGLAVEVMERVRQVGPDKQGARGSYSIYRLADAG